MRESSALIGTPVLLRGDSLVEGRVEDRYVGATRHVSVSMVTTIFSQVRDEYRRDFDPDRGGFGRKVGEAQVALYEMMTGPDQPDIPPPSSLPILPHMPVPIAEKTEQTVTPNVDVKMETN